MPEFVDDANFPVVVNQHMSQERRQKRRKKRLITHEVGRQTENAGRIAPATFSHVAETCPDDDWKIETS